MISTNPTDEKQPGAPDDCIRPVDGYEIALVGCWISARCVLPQGTTQSIVMSNLTSGLPSLIAKHLPLRLSIRKNHTGALFFVPASSASLNPLALVRVDVEWPDCDALDVDSLPRGVDAKAPNEALFQLRICTDPKTTRVGIRVDFNHVLCDGRTAFNLLAMFCNVCLSGTDETVDPCLSLPQFGHRDYFTDDVHDALARLDRENRIPESWMRIPRGLGRLVSGFPEPAVYENTTYRYALSPVVEFCSRMGGRDKGYSVQALLMAAKTRAVREYVGLPSSQPLAVYAPTDTRGLPWSTDINNSTPFFCHAGCNVPLVCGSGDVAEDVRRCGEAMHACIKSMDPCLQFMRSARTVDPKTLVFSPDKQTPNTTEDYLVAASSLGNVGRVLPKDCGNDANDVWLGCTYPCNTAFFSLNIYGYITANTLSILSMRPSTLDPSFASILHKNLDEIFIELVGSHALS